MRYYEELRREGQYRGTPHCKKAEYLGGRDYSPIHE